MGPFNYDLWTSSVIAEGPQTEGLTGSKSILRGIQSPKVLTSLWGLKAPKVLGSLKGSQRCKGSKGRHVEKVCSNSP